MRLIKNDDNIVNIYNDSYKLLGYIDEKGVLFGMKKDGYAYEIQPVESATQAKEKLEDWIKLNVVD